MMLVASKILRLFFWVLVFLGFAPSSKNLVKDDQTGLGTRLVIARNSDKVVMDS